MLMMVATLRIVMSDGGDSGSENDDVNTGGRNGGGGRDSAGDGERW